MQFSNKVHRPLIIVLLISLSVISFAQAPTINNIQAFQIDVEVLTNPIPNSDIGLMVFDVSPNTNDSYLNVIAQYTGVPIQNWSIQNLYIPDNSHYPAQHMIAQRFDLAPFGINDGTDMDQMLLLNYFLTDVPLQDQGSFPPLATGTVEASVGNISESAENTADDTTGAGEPPASPPPQNPDNSDPVTKLVYRGCEVPNVELDNSTHPPVVDGYAGDNYACAPAAAANSLLWMRNKFPGQFDDIPSDQRTLLEELSGYMNRAAGSGVPLDDFVRGKLNFIKDKGLNIQVKFQSESEGSNITSGDVFAQNQNTGDNPSWDWLVGEMEDMEDVEMWFRWWDPVAEKWRDHMVVITGVEERGVGSTISRRTIKFKHDMEQLKNGSNDNVQEAADVFIDSEGRMHFKLQSGRPAYVRNVVSESPGDPFPVELNLFEGNYFNGSVMLNWETATEIDNYGFEVERAALNSNISSASGNNNNFQMIGFVQGYGNSNSPKIYSLIDREPINGMNLYRLKQIDNDGSFEYSKVIYVNADSPKDFKLYQNYPNPFNPITTIKFIIPQVSSETNNGEKLNTKLSVYDPLGRKVAEIVNDQFAPGAHEIEFEGNDLPSGIYFYNLTAGSFSDTKKFLLLK